MKYKHINDTRMTNNTTNSEIDDKEKKRVNSIRFQCKIYYISYFVFFSSFPLVFSFVSWIFLFASILFRIFFTTESNRIFCYPFFFSSAPVHRLFHFVYSYATFALARSKKKIGWKQEAEKYKKDENENVFCAMKRWRKTKNWTKTGAIRPNEQRKTYSRLENTINFYHIEISDEQIIHFIVTFWLGHKKKWKKKRKYWKLKMSHFRIDIDAIDRLSTIMRSWNQTSKFSFYFRIINRVVLSLCLTKT